MRHMFLPGKKRTHESGNTEKLLANVGECDFCHADLPFTVVRYTFTAQCASDDLVPETDSLRDWILSK